MRNVLITTLLLLTVGCANLSVKNAVPLNQIPNVSDLEKDYYIHVGDIVQLRDENAAVEAVPMEVPVLPDGKIMVPHLDEAVQIAGMSVEKAAAKIRMKYRRIVRNPLITLNIIEFAPRQVYVGGEVDEPAAVPYRGRTMSALDAITTAGYFTDRSNLEHVILIRYQGVGNAPKVLALNVEDAIENRDLRQNLALMPEDIIVVPRTRIANANLWVDQYINGIIPDVIGTIGTVWAIDEITD